MILRLLLLLLLLSSNVYAQERLGTNYNFCFKEDTRDLCKEAPFDLNTLEGGAFYHFLNGAQQEPFDRFAWRNFVGINWPLSGGPKWRKFAGLDEVMGRKMACDKPKGGLYLHRFHQSDGRPLIDQEGNYVLYDVHLNKVAQDYIQHNNLNSLTGLKAIKQVNFPAGNLKSGQEGAMLVKTAWRWLGEKTDSHLFMSEAVIEVSAGDSLKKKTQCLYGKVGLIGMHFVQKTTVGMGDHWIWSTFEHNDNVPVSSTAKHPAISFTINALKKNCTPPAQSEQAYHLYSAVEAGVSGDGIWKWADKEPFAVNEQGQHLAPDQVVRCWNILDETMSTNRIWQKEMSGLVWANYMLISTQWRGNTGGEGFGIGELPRFLANTTMESFIQDTSSCMSCHKDAADPLGRASDFTFIFQNVR